MRNARVRAVGRASNATRLKDLFVLAALLGTWGGASAALADDISVHSTGVGSTGLVLAPGSSDPHWVITQVPSGEGFTTPGSAVVARAHFAYLQNNAVGTAGSSWIATSADTDAFHTPGTYVFRTTFDLTGLDPDTAQLTGSFAVDNTVSSVLLNGVSVGISGGAFNAWTNFTIASGFQDGTNTLEFVVGNLGSVGNPSGFRATLSGTADPAFVPDTTAPVIDGVADHTYEYSGSAVTLSAASLGITATDEVDGDVDVSISPSSVGLGTHEVTASATDAAGNTATETFTVSVVDTTAPVIHSLSSSPSVLEGAALRMVPVAITASVSDAGDSAPTVRIVSICSTGGGTRSSTDQVITGDLTAELRVVRAGSEDRVYHITVEAVDDSGNRSTAVISVAVLHDRR